MTQNIGRFLRTCDSCNVSRLLEIRNRESQAWKRRRPRSFPYFLTVRD